VGWDRFDEDDIWLTGHAEDRAWERGFTAADVAELLSTPHETFPGDPRLGSGKWVHQYPEVRLVTGEVWTDGSIDIITVMWREFEEDEPITTECAA